MSWPQWPLNNPAQQGITQPPILNPAPNVSTSAVPSSQYTAEQWAQMQHQNWQQWVQWQQQFQLWQQQYGAEYQKSMNAIAQSGVPTQPSAPTSFMNVPPPPIEAKPPPPPDEGLQTPTTFAMTATLSTPSAYTTAPPVQPLLQTPSISNRNAQISATKSNFTQYDGNTQQQTFNHNPNHNRAPNMNWQGQNHNRQQPYFNRFNQPPPSRNDGDNKFELGMKRPGMHNLDSDVCKRNKADVNEETKALPRPVEVQPSKNVEELSEAEKKFDKQFHDWEAQFQKWKEQNANHPDKEQYREYEKKWEMWRSQLLDRREQMKRKRLGLSNTLSQSTGNITQKKLEQGRPVNTPPTQQQPHPDSQINTQNEKKSEQEVDAPKMSERKQEVSSKSLNVGFLRPPPNLNNQPLEFKKVHESFGIEPEEEGKTGGDLIEFLKSETSVGIPGLDLVKDTSETENSQESKVTAEPPKTDFEAISRGINNILRDQKLMNMLSLVSQTHNSFAKIETKVPSPKFSPTDYNQDDCDDYETEHMRFQEMDDSQPYEPNSSGNSKLNTSESYDSFPNEHRQFPQFGNNERNLLNKNFENFDGAPRSGDFSREFNQNALGPNNFGKNQFNRGPNNDTFNRRPPNFNNNLDNLNRGFDNLNRGPDHKMSDKPNFNRGSEDFNRNQENFGRGPDQFNKNFGNFNSRENFNRGPDRLNTDEDFHRQHDRFNRGTDNFNRPSDNFNRDSDNFNRNSDNFNRGPDNFSRFQDNFNRGRDNFNRTPTNFERGPDNFNRGFDNFNRNFDGFNKGPDNFNRNANFNRGPDNVRGPHNANKEPDVRKDTPFFNRSRNFGDAPNKFNQDFNRNSSLPNQDNSTKRGPDNLDMFNEGRNVRGNRDPQLGNSTANIPIDSNRFPNRDLFSTDRNISNNRNENFNKQFDPNKIPAPGDTSMNLNFDGFLKGNAGMERNKDGNLSNVRNANDPARLGPTEQLTSTENDDLSNTNKLPPTPNALPNSVQLEDLDPDEGIWKTKTVVDYDHKSLFEEDFDIILEAFHTFDYRHKPFKRIPYPSRPKWLTEMIGKYPEFDIPSSRNARVVEYRSYPTKRFESSYHKFDDRGRKSYDDRGRRSLDDFDRDRNTYDDRNRRSFDDKERRISDKGRKKYDDKEKRNFDERDRRPYEERNKPSDEHQKSKSFNDEDEQQSHKKKKLFDKNFEDFDEDEDFDFDAPDDRVDEKFEQELKQSVNNSESSSQSASKSNVLLIEDILSPPGRFSRPPRIVIILRGPPGSGKSFLAKLIKDKEVENGGSAPRILCLDDYFMVEQETEVEEDGRKMKVKEMVYEYEEEMEGIYRQSLIKSFKKTITDGYFNFIIVDNVNDKVKYFGEMWSFAKQNGFQVYICQMELDVQICSKRNIHGRSESDIEKCVSGWEPTPSHHPVLDATSLIQSGSIPEVEMEEINSPSSEHLNEEREFLQERLIASKWDNFDYSLDNLAKLDGTNKPLRPNRTMEDYLQLDDDWVQPVSSKPGQKRVRWADLEERKEQEKMRAIGFVVGHTNWDRMMDPTMGSSALTQTKYIERYNKY